MLDNNMNEEEREIYNEIISEKKSSFKKHKRKSFDRPSMSFYDSLNKYVSDYEAELISSKYEKFLKKKKKDDSNAMFKDGIGREKIVCFLLNENFSKSDADDIADLYIYGKTVVKKLDLPGSFEENDVKESRVLFEDGVEESVYSYIEDEDGLEWKVESDKYVVNNDNILTIEEMYNFIKSNDIIKYDETLYSIISEYYYPDYNPYVIYEKEVDGRSTIDEELFKKDIDKNYDDIKKIIHSILNSYELSCGKESVVYKSIVEAERWVDNIKNRNNKCE